MTGVPVSTEGKTSACAHSDLAGNLIAAVCDLWSNEAVEYHDMFGATTRLWESRYISEFTRISFICCW
jgi:methanol--5-hydroxybenzimidazolylcobamide Co-methyltransferase